MAYLVTEALKHELAQLCKAYEVSELLMFGSGVRDDFEPGKSDIDLLVGFRPGSRVGYIRLFELQEDLKRLFHREVHLISKQGLRPFFRESVLAEATPLYHETR